MIHSRVSECHTKPRTALKRVRLIVVHHTSLARAGADNPEPISDELLTGPELARRFVATSALGTGRCVPYHALILTDGSVDQLLPLDVMGAHALGYNAESLAVAYVGEDRGPTSQQWRALVRVCRAWVVLTGGAAIVGHTQLDGASKDQAKRCPHPSLDLHGLVTAVLERLPADWRALSVPEREELLRRDGWTITAAPAAEEVT